MPQTYDQIHNEDDDKIKITSTLDCETDVSGLQGDLKSSTSQPPSAYKLLENYYWLQPLSVILVTATLTFLQYLVNKEEYDNHSPSFSMLYCLWILPLPFVLLGFVGTCLPYKDTNKNNKPAYPRSYNRLFLLVCTRGINEDAVQRTWESIRELEDPEKQIWVKIITEEDHPLNQIPEKWKLKLPSSFKCTKAKYKARALEYFRAVVHLKDDDFVYHLDEESIISRYELDAALNFIRNTTHDLGQGLILYNAWNFWGGAGLQGLLSNICDNIRLGDDLGRFHLQYTYLHKSLFGCHGSNLLISGKLTNSITWNNDSLTEDFFFAVRAQEKGFTCGHFEGFCREQSPDNLHDLMKQRRRWFLGISRSSNVHARVHTFFWVLGSLACLLTFINMFLERRLHPLWAVALFVFIYANFIVIYMTATILQTYDAGYSLLKMAFCLLVVFFLQPLCALIEALSIMYAIVSPVRTFDVIRK